jgi:hypothetical protein
MFCGYPANVTAIRGLTEVGVADPSDVIDDLRDYLSAVSAEFGVGLESCCWAAGTETPAWAYVALDGRLAGEDLALLWNEKAGWAAATETNDSRDIVIIARLQDELKPPPSTVAKFVAKLKVSRFGT